MLVKKVRGRSCVFRGAESTHLNGKNAHARLLFTDFSSASNAVLSRLVSTLRDLCLCNSICKWLYDFLSGRPQTWEYITASHPPVSSTQRVAALVLYSVICSHTTVLPKTIITALWNLQGIIIDFRSLKTVLPPLYTNDAPIEIFNSLKFLAFWSLIVCLGLQTSIVPLKRHNRDCILWDAWKSLVYLLLKLVLTSIMPQMGAFSWVAYWYGFATWLNKPIKNFVR